MANLVADIISLAAIQAEETYDTPTWIKYINAALDDLTSVIKLLKTKSSIAAVTSSTGAATITISGDADLTKAFELISVFFTPTSGTIRQLRRLPFNDNVSEGWKLTSTTINIQVSGANSDATATARVDYYQKLQHVTGESDSIETVTSLPEQYHNLLVNYCVAKSQQREEELNDANSAYSEYMSEKNSLAIDRIWQMEPHNRKFIRNARIAALIGGNASQ